MFIEQLLEEKDPKLEAPLTKVLSAISTIIGGSTKKYTPSSERLLSSLRNSPFDTKQLLECINQPHIPQRNPQQLHPTCLFSINRKQASDLCRPLIKSVEHTFDDCHSSQESYFQHTPSIITLELLH